MKKTRQALRRSGACLIAGQRTGQTLIAWGGDAELADDLGLVGTSGEQLGACSLGLRGGRVLVVPQGGEEQLAWRRPSLVGQQGTNSTHISPQPDTQEPLQ